ncbi:hypothetical protein CJP72_24360 [Citrobacter sp. NCU1]|uniref:DUF202 domain-containing protein n=1 Tax=Citrobacter sp. NCU1 TaxID=2026683 RepID=UPI0013912D60|nr:hypothetical protein [Citrobacter sp. NCU1]
MKRDPGLQPERTHLSWRRTGWSMLLPGLLCLRGWSHTGNALYVLAGILLMGGSFAMFCGLGHGRHYLISLNVMISGTVILLMTTFNI